LKKLYKPEYIFCTIGTFFFGDFITKTIPFFPLWASFVLAILCFGIAIYLHLSRKDGYSEGTVFGEINKENLSNWCKIWGSLYDYINRIVLYSLPPYTEQKYLLYFELDVFTQNGRKQYESYDWGGWSNPHFPLEEEDVEKFKSVYRTTPQNEEFINAWEFSTEKPLGVNELKSMELYKKTP